MRLSVPEQASHSGIQIPRVVTTALHEPLSREARCVAVGRRLASGDPVGVPAKVYTPRRYSRILAYELLSTEHSGCGHSYLSFRLHGRHTATRILSSSTTTSIRRSLVSAGP